MFKLFTPSNFHFSLSFSGLIMSHLASDEIVQTALHSSHYRLHSLSIMQSNKYTPQNRHHLLTGYAFVKLWHPLFSVNFWFDTNLPDYDPCLLHHSVPLTPSGTYHPCSHNTPKESKKRRKRERETKEKVVISDKLLPKTKTRNKTYAIKLAWKVQFEGPDLFPATEALQHDSFYMCLL